MKQRNFKDFGEVALAAIATHYNNQEARDYIGISQIGYCNRKLFLQAGTKPEFDDRTITRFYRGHANHEYLPSILWGVRGELPGYKYKKSEGELKIKVGDYELKGHYDHLAELNGVPTVIDWKFVDYTNKLEGPHRHNVDQLMVYAYALGVEDIQVVYFDSANVMQYKAFNLKIDMGRVEELLAKYKTLMDAIKAKQIPEKAFENPEDSIWECYRCNAYQTCWGDRMKVFGKSDESLEIEEELAKQYAELAELISSYEEKKDELKETVANLLQGKRGTSKYVTFNYIVPKEPKPVIDEKAAEKFAKDDPKFAAVLDQCYVTPKPKNPYYSPRLVKGE